MLKSPVLQSARIKRIFARKLEQKGCVLCGSGQHYRRRQCRRGVRQRAFGNTAVSKNHSDGYQPAKGAGLSDGFEPCRGVFSLNTGALRRDGRLRRLGADRFYSGRGAKAGADAQGAVRGQCADSAPDAAEAGAQVAKGRRADRYQPGGRDDLCRLAVLRL